MLEPAELRNKFNVNRPTREQLLGYLLDALDEHERSEIERRLVEDEECRVELKCLKAALEPLEALRDEDCDPPFDLAERTSALVFEHADAVAAAAPQLARAGVGGPMPPVAGRWSMADMVVAIGVCAVAALLFFPVISNSRYAAHVTACQNNLRQIGYAVADYSDKVGGGFFPGASSRGNRAFAGIYAPILVEGGYLTDPRVVICPSSHLLQRRAVFRLPTLDEIDLASSTQIVALQDRAGGTYGYSLGAVVDGRYEPPRNLGRNYFALMSDRPLLYGEPVVNAPHWGRGLNLLYEDGHVAFGEAQLEYADQDDPFRNRRGLVEAGVDENDAVIGQSVASPFRFISQGIRPAQD